MDREEALLLFRRVHARDVRGEPRPGEVDLPMIAARLLADGDNGEAILNVALLAPGEQPTEEAVAALIEALGGTTLDPSGAHRYFVEEAARDIVAGRVSPYEGACTLRRLANDVFDEEERWLALRDFVGAASEWEDAPAFRPELDLQIVQQARRLLASEHDA